MAKLLVEIQDELLADLIPAARQSNMSIDAFLAEAARGTLVDDGVDFQVVDVEEVLDTALDAARALKKDHIFHLTDLIDDDVWAAIGPGPRKALGKRFRKVIEEKEIAKYVNRTSSGLAIYKRL